MEGFVVLSFMLIPAFGSLIYASYVLFPAVLINIVFIRFPAVFRIIQITTSLVLFGLLIYLSQGEVGRNGIFLLIYLLSFTFCFFVYVWLTNKMMNNTNLEKSKTTSLEIHATKDGKYLVGNKEFRTNRDAEDYLKVLKAVKN